MVCNDWFGTVAELKSLSQAGTLGQPRMARAEGASKQPSLLWCICLCPQYSISAELHENISFPRAPTRLLAERTHAKQPPPGKLRPNSYLTPCNTKIHSTSRSHRESCLGVHGLRGTHTQRCRYSRVDSKSRPLRYNHPQTIIYPLWPYQGQHSGARERNCRLRQIPQPPTRSWACSP